jgi:hypothetical protein
MISRTIFGEHVVTQDVPRVNDPVPKGKADDEALQTLNLYDLDLPGPEEFDELIDVRVHHERYGKRQWLRAMSALTAQRTRAKYGPKEDSKENRVWLNQVMIRVRDEMLEEMYQKPGLRDHDRCAIIPIAIELYLTPTLSDVEASQMRSSGPLRARRQAGAEYHAVADNGGIVDSLRGLLGRERWVAPPQSRR